MRIEINTNRYPTKRAEICALIEKNNEYYDRVIRPKHDAQHERAMAKQERNSE